MTTDFLRTSRYTQNFIKVVGWNWRIFFYWQGVRFRKIFRAIDRRLNPNVKDPPTRFEIVTANRIAREKAKRDELRSNYDEWFAIEAERQSHSHAKAGQREHYELIASQLPPGWIIMPVYQAARDDAGRLWSQNIGLYDIKAADGHRATLDGKRHVIEGEGWTVSDYWNGVYREYSITSPDGAVALMGDFFNA